jgi:3-hydroxybutyryl-CoA dehydrogenase
MKLEGIEHIALIGTGMIGSSLAALFSGNGYRVTMLAHSVKGEAGGRARYRQFFDELIKKKLVSEAQFKRCSELLSTSFEYEDIADADVVFECVPENIELKYEVYKMIEENCIQLKAAVSTSSAKSPDDLAGGFERCKDRFLVAHPFNPAHLVPFVEIVKGEMTNAAAVSVIYALLESTGRKPIIANRSVPGFIATRLQHALLREASYLVDEGIASPEDIDKALMYSFMPRYTKVGLFQHQDAAGLDMVKSIQDYLCPSLCCRTDTPDFIAEHFNKGELGMKTGKGIYDWPDEAQKDFHRKAAEPYFRFFDWDLPE